MTYICILALLLGMRLWRRYDRIIVKAVPPDPASNEMVSQRKGPDDNPLKS
jgi:hypothetical protein